MAARSAASSSREKEQQPVSCGEVQSIVDDGYCLDLNIYQNGTTPETYVATWTGKWLQNDDRTFYIVVFDFSDEVDECTQPYQLTVQAAGL